MKTQQIRRVYPDAEIMIKHLADGGEGFVDVLVSGAGGIGFTFLSYMNAQLLPGIEFFLQETHLEDDIRNADIIITEEGRIDGQTAMGKAPAGVARLAKKFGKPVIEFAGSTEKNAALINEHGIVRISPYFTQSVPLMKL